MAFAEFIQTAEGLISLISAIGTFLGVFFAVKNWIKALKEKNAKQIWELICQIADAAMKEYEHSTLHGADKKAAVIEAVKEGCKAGRCLQEQKSRPSLRLPECVQKLFPLKCRNQCTPELRQHRVLPKEVLLHLALHKWLFPYRQR